MYVKYECMIGAFVWATEVLRNEDPTWIKVQNASVMSESIFWDCAKVCMVYEFACMWMCVCALAVNCKLPRNEYDTSRWPYKYG